MQLYGVQSVAPCWGRIDIGPARTPAFHLNSTAAFLTVCQMPQKSGMTTGSQAKTTSTHSVDFVLAAASIFGTADSLASRQQVVQVATISKRWKFYATGLGSVMLRARAPRPAPLESCNIGDPPVSP